MSAVNHCFPPQELDFSLCLAVPPQKVQRKSLWAVPAFVFLLAGSLTFGVEAFSADRTPTFYGFSEKSAIRLNDPVSTNRVLAMHVERQGERLLLTWDGDDSILKTAGAGVLHISDGLRNRTCQLKGTVLRNGSVLYKPISNDVAFRLEIMSSEGVEVKESIVRVLNGIEQQTSTLPAAFYPAPIPPLAKTVNRTR